MCQSPTAMQYIIVLPKGDKPAWLWVQMPKNMKMNTATGAVVDFDLYQKKYLASKAMTMGPINNANKQWCFCIIHEIGESSRQWCDCYC